MYNSQEIAQIIKKMAKERNITIKQLLENCNLNINTISELSKGKQISYINFAIIADNLGCSVDYLLGRTDAPQENTINNQNATITDSVQAIKSPVTINSSKENKDTDKDDEQLLEMIKSLNLVERSKIIVMIDDMRKGA